jgi:hypothetical protein
VKTVPAWCAGWGSGLLRSNDAFHKGHPPSRAVPGPPARTVLARVCNARGGFMNATDHGNRVLKVVARLRLGSWVCRNSRSTSSGPGACTIGWRHSRICRCAAAHASGNHRRHLLADPFPRESDAVEAIAATLRGNREGAEAEEEADAA